MKKLLFCITLSLAGLFAFALPNPDDIIGTWKNGSGKGHIQIYKENGKYYGKIIWLRDSVDVNGNPKTDRHNRNPALQTKPLIGTVMMRDFSFSNGKWSDGRLYNPSDGKEYNAHIKMQDNNTITVRGFLGFSFIGKSDTWTRVSG